MRARTLRAAQDGTDLGNLIGSFYATLRIRGVPEDEARFFASDLLYKTVPETWINYARDDYDPEASREIVDHSHEATEER